MTEVIQLLLIALLIATVLHTMLHMEPFQHRSEVTIDVPVDKLYRYVSDLRYLPDWLPWQAQDDDVRFSSRVTEQGSQSLRWRGNGSVGLGQAVVVEQQLPHALILKLTWLRPLPAEHRVEFMLLPRGNMTQLKMEFHANHDWISRFLRIFSKRNEKVGQDFELGLTNLKQRFESAS